jgi:hypothetical protein
MLVSVARYGSTIRSPVAFTRRARFSTRQDSLLGANEGAHSIAPIAIIKQRITTAFEITIIRIICSSTVLKHLFKN